jgi:hypothetical protein
MEYSTTSEALEHYKHGWIQIMDEGRYGAAKVSYRKALELDSDFLAGKNVLARLTLDLEERLKLYVEIQERKNKTQGDERLVLDIYTALVKYTNLRDEGATNTKNALPEALKLAENNLGKIVHKYP